MLRLRNRLFNTVECNVWAGACVAEGMRLRGRDLEDSAISWIPNVLGVQSFRLRLRLDRRDDRGRSLWQLVDLDEEAATNGQRLRDRTPPTCSQSLMSIPATSGQTGAGEMQSPAAVSPSFLPPPTGKVPGRKRGRPPLKRHPEYQNHYPESLPPIKVPKKRGRKPGFKLKSRLAMTPLAISPPSSTPEPDMSSIPQDAATVPHSATPEVLTVCIYVNKHVNTGPNLDRQKVLQLPDHLGPARPSVVLQQAVQGCIDSAYQQKAVFTLLTQGYGGEKISATFDGKQHLLSLPVVNSVGYVLRFLKKLCRSLLCENLFSDQPIAPSSSPSSSSSFHTDKHSEGQAKSTYSPSPEAGESKPPSSKDPSRWSVEEVVWFIKDADPQALGPHVELFRKHEIDGDALLLLKSDMIMKYLGLKLGPALKLCYHIDKLKQNKF
ncbi:sex comb on midleg-like protein 4 isoform X4 [Pygocentrus nattereri]|uniref:sex comb on midleg-like protein 4 isoform X4 n=1 Tax=Pygocentrus nattereri TaxID=42514 RepID=UPI001891760F|nr:sex comb on midleg-like protein 4 isoform X4 [Pygocentrus nattereri]